jgi:hypothetical protein
MNRKIVLLNVLLLAALASLGWLLRTRWLEARAKERAVLSKAARRAELLPPPTPAVPVPAAASDYQEVVAKTLFAKDRDPNVAPVIEVPPPPPPPEPIPPRPAYHGQMGIGPEPVALLSTDSKNTQRSYRVGDDVGPFKLVDFDREKIKFEWHGKTLEYKLSELKPKEPVAAPPPQDFQTNATQPVAAAPAKPEPPDNKSPTIGEPMGSVRACTNTDRSPPGTVVDGYKKVFAQGMLGTQCFWEPIK